MSDDQAFDETKLRTLAIQKLHTQIDWTLMQIDDQYDKCGQTRQRTNSHEVEAEVSKAAAELLKARVELLRFKKEMLDAKA